METRDVFAPLAHRLGMWKLKAELEDLVLKTLEPKIFNKISRRLSSTSKQMQKYIDNFSNPIIEELEKFNITHTIQGRSKNKSSIYHKMVNKNKDFTEEAIKLAYDSLDIKIKNYIENKSLLDQKFPIINAFE